MTAPAQVSGLHQQFRAKLQSEVETSRGLKLTQSEEAPAVITIVNSSRVVADIKRDLGRIHGSVLRKMFYYILLNAVK